MIGARDLYRIARLGLGRSQGILRLFTAGSVLVGAHQLFLRYYQREWEGLKASGVNGCEGDELIANADLFAGQTFCNEPENFVPWIEVYRHHPVAAAIYYGVALAIILAFGLAIGVVYRRMGGRKPFGATPKPLPTTDHEHLR